MSDKEADDRKQLRDLIKDIKFAMFTTRHANGHLHSRPMTTQNSRLDDENALWFFMSRGGDAATDLASDSAVNISYADPGKDAYVSVSGNARIVEDRAKKEELWTPMAKGWFPGGADDPDLALVRVSVVHASYWNVTDSKIVQLFAMAKSAVTGKPPKDLGDHGTVRSLH